MPGNYKKYWIRCNKSTNKRSTQFGKGQWAHCYQSEKSANETEKILFAEAKIKPIPIWRFPIQCRKCSLDIS